MICTGKANSSNISLSPLPDLSPIAEGSDFYLQTDFYVSLDSLSSTTTKMLKGKDIQLGKRKIIIKNCSFSNIGQGRLTAKIDFDGWRKGYLYLVGVPVFNNLTQEVSLSNVNFDIKTQSLILKIAKWLYDKRITETIQSRAKYTVRPKIDELKEKLNGQLNRTLDKVQLSGNVNIFEIKGIAPVKNSILLRSELKGNLSASLIGF